MKIIINNKEYEAGLLFTEPKKVNQADIDALDEDSKSAIEEVYEILVNSKKHNQHLNGLLEMITGE